jgi:methionyl-tRNA formyltransferase
MRIIFMGTAELSCASLEALAGNQRFSLAAIVTQPDRPKGRELKPQPPPVKLLAEKLRRPVFQPARARDEKFINELRGLAPDLIVVAAYGQILPPAILDLPRHGCLNVHTSLLPKYRGAAPIQWAIAHGDAETGVTIMKMDAGLDTGDIVAQRRTAIQPADDSATLHARLARLGAELLLATIPDYVAGKIQPQPQPAEGVSHAPKIKKEDGRMDWNRPAVELWNRLRAFTPWPGAFTFLRAARTTQPRAVETGGPAARAPLPDKTLPPLMLKIWRVEVVEMAGDAGTFLAVDKSGIVVACGQKALRILELQPEGARRMMTAEFLAGHPLQAGDRFEA